MIKRIFLGGLLTALTFVAVPIDSASADHDVEPCSDPTAENAGLVQTGTVGHGNKEDVWALPQEGLPQRAWTLVAPDGDISVKQYLDRNGKCAEIQHSGCVETEPPSICHRRTPDWQGDLYLVVENPPGQGSSTNYVLQVIN